MDKQAMQDWARHVMSKTSNPHDALVCGLDFYTDCPECQRRFFNDAEYLSESIKHHASLTKSPGGNS